MGVDFLFHHPDPVSFTERVTLADVWPEAQRTKEQVTFQTGIRSKNSVDRVKAGIMSLVVEI